MLSVPCISSARVGSTSPASLTPFLVRVGLHQDCPLSPILLMDRHSRHSHGVEGGLVCWPQNWVTAFCRWFGLGGIIGPMTSNSFGGSQSNVKRPGWGSVPSNLSPRFSPFNVGQRFEADTQWIPWRSADQLYLLLFQWIVWFQCCVVEPQSSGRKWRHLRADMKIWLKTIELWVFCHNVVTCSCTGNVSSPVPCLCPMTAQIVSRQQWNIDKTAKYWRKTFLNFQLTIFISWLNTRQGGIGACRNLSILSVLIIAASHRANWKLLPMYGIVCTGWIGPAGCSWDEVIRGV